MHSIVQIVWKLSTQLMLIKQNSTSYTSAGQLIRWLIFLGTVTEWKGKRPTRSKRLTHLGPYKQQAATPTEKLHRFLNKTCVQAGLEPNVHFRRISLKFSSACSSIILHHLRRWYETSTDGIARGSIKWRTNITLCLLVEQLSHTWRAMSSSDRK